VLLLVYLLSGFSPIFLLLAITAAPFSLIIAMIVALFLVMYRRRGREICATALLLMALPPMKLVSSSMN
jgi:ABC-type spermidine/putrescine transport system permease subunit II